MTAIPGSPHSRSQRDGQRLFAFLAILTVTAISPGTATGQTQPADSAGSWITRSRLVFGASRYAQDVSEAPASVTIVTAEEIENLGLRTLADIVALGAGVFTHYDRNYAYATFRGMSRQSDFNTRILLLIDGHRVNDAGTDASGIGTDALIDVTAIERVEIINGPGSALFGTNAFFGVVNVVTRHGRSLRGLGLRVEGASFGVSRGALTWGGRQPAGAEILVSMAAERREGSDLYYPEFDTSSTRGIARGLDGERAYRALVKARRGDFSFLGASSLRLRRVPTASYSTTFNDPRLRNDDRTATAVVKYEHAFADLSRLFVSTAFDRYEYEGTWPYDDMVTRDYNDSRAWSLAAEYLQFLGSGSKLAMGGEARWLNSGRIGAWDETANGERVELFSLDRSTFTGAAFGQLEWRLGDHAILYAGARHDWYESFAGTTNPRVALVVRPRGGLTVKVLHGRAFRAPNLYELHYEDAGQTQKAPPGLAPETVESSELSLEHQLGSRAWATVSAYTVRTRALINLRTDPSDGLLVFANEGQPRSEGIEFKLAGSLGRFRVRAAYALQQAQDDALQTPVNSPRHVGYASASVPIRGNRGTGSFFVRHVGARPTLDGSTAPAYTLVGAALLARPLAGPLEVSAQVLNLFDVAYADPGGEEHVQQILPRDGRSFRLGVRYRF